ncbi:MAG: SDR family NAD(P)-dependent oxidoreductase [Planctomycetaceae bacterium]
MDQLFSVKDRVTLITGGSRGIGKGIAAGFAERGAKTIICSRDETVLKATADELSTDQNQVEWTVCDVAKPDDIKSCVAKTIEDHGKIDILINVAGVNRRKPADTVTEDDYDFILDINLKGAFLMSQEVGRHMIANGGGVQVNIESLNTYAPLKGVAPYAMSKGGMMMMTRSLALEWGPHNVRVNSLCPGFILTDLTTKLWAEPTMQAWSDENTPLKRLGVPEDMIGGAVFLASDASAFMTGQCMYVDGGVSAGMNWPIPLGTPAVS